MSRGHTPVPVTSVFMRTLALGLALMAVGAAVAGCEKQPSAAGARPVTTVAIYADYPGYLDADALVDGADAVIVGVVSAAESRQVDVDLEGDPVGEPYLVSTVKVEQVIKGGVKAGDTIEAGKIKAAPGSTLFATPRTEEELVSELDGLVD